MSIPKIIHYCWFGKAELPASVQHYINTWKKICPDYEIIEWNEDNFDIHNNQYAKEAYENKKWAFVSDVARLHALSTYGGIYLDTDVEIVKCPVFPENASLVLGFESNKAVSTAFIACEKKQQFITKLLEDYSTLHFVNEDGSFNTETNVARLTKELKEKGFVINNKHQMIDDIILYPKDYFSPKSYDTGEIQTTLNTVAIHHFEGTWISDEEYYFQKKRDSLKKYMPASAARYIARMFSLTKYHGLTYMIKRLFSKFHLSN